jgi:uncharacterized membrane protein
LALLFLRKKATWALQQSGIGKVGHMKNALSLAAKSIIGGLLVVVPIYLAVLVLLKGMKSVVGLVRPFAMLLPDWIPAEKALSLMLVLVICFLIGAAVRTPAGRAVRERIEKTFFERIPGYALFRSFTQQVAGDSRQKVWKPALVEFDESLVLGFIIEEFEDGRYTVFVPSIPTPLAGAVYILERKRVRPLNVPFTEALKVVSRWGSGSKELVAAMETGATLPKSAETGSGR